MSFRVLPVKYILRGLRTKSGNARLNYGVQRRLDLLLEENPDIDKVELTNEKLEDFENGVVSGVPFSDRMKIENKATAHFKKIERKFFKQKTNYNLLTWSEKEQIRYLYNLDPLSWSPEKLSECFPATAEIIKKVIKSQWKPASSDKITSHDEAVAKHWKAVEAGDIELPPDLSAHIKNFITRKKAVNINSTESMKEIENNPVPTTTSTEFADIIRSYKEGNSKKNASQPNNKYNSSVMQPNTMSETYVLNTKDKLPLKHKYYTLQQLKKELLSKIPQEKLPKENTNESDEYLVQENEPKVDPELVPFNSKNVSIGNKFKMTEAIDNEFRSEPIPLKINIQKDKVDRSKKHLYKVKDCYYNSKGEFLYRVPGMT